MINKKFLNWVKESKESKVSYLYEVSVKKQYNLSEDSFSKGLNLTKDIIYYIVKNSDYDIIQGINDFLDESEEDNISVDIIKKMDNQKLSKIIKKFIEYKYNSWVKFCNEFFLSYDNEIDEEDHKIISNIPIEIEFDNDGAYFRLYKISIMPQNKIYNKITFKIDLSRALKNDEELSWVKEYLIDAIEDMNDILPKKNRVEFIDGLYFNTSVVIKCDIKDINKKI